MLQRSKRDNYPSDLGDDDEDDKSEQEEEDADWVADLLEPQRRGRVLPVGAKDGACAHLRMRSWDIKDI